MLTSRTWMPVLVVMLLAAGALVSDGSAYAYTNLGGFDAGRPNHLNSTDMYHANDDYFEITANMSHIISKNNLLANDLYESESEEIQFTAEGNVTVLDIGLGSYAITPDEGFVGVTTFTYGGVVGGDPFHAAVIVNVTAIDTMSDVIVNMTADELMSDERGNMTSSKPASDGNGNTTTINPEAGINVATDKIVSDGNASITMPGILSNVSLTASDYEIHVMPSQTVMTNPVAEGHVQDPDGADTLAIDITRGPSIGSATANGTVISYTADRGSSGENRSTTTTIVYVISDDNGGTATGIITLIIGQGPMLDFIDDRSVAVHDTLKFRIGATDPDGDPLTYDISGQPHGASITATGTFSWTPDDSQTGSHTFTVTVSDGTYSDSQNVTVTASMAGAINRNPKAPDILVSADPDLPTGIAPKVTDPDGDDTMITSVTGVALGTINTDWLPADYIIYAPGQIGVDAITYTVSDGRGGTDSGTIYVYTGEPDNTRPMLYVVYAAGARAGSSLNFTVIAADFDGDALTFGLANAPEGAIINAATGYFSWTPTDNDVGNHTVTITVHDGRGGADWQDVPITVLSEGATNHDPVAENVTTTVVFGTVNAIKLPVSDQDSDDIIITSVSGAEHGTILDAYLRLGTVMYVASNSLGEDTVTYTVSDGRGGTATGTISITVIKPPNISPVLDYVGSSSVNVGDTLNFTATAIDIDDVALKFSIEDMPQGATITDRGRFDWTPAPSQVGRHDITVTVSDGRNGTDSERFTVFVRDAESVNRPPAAPDFIITTSQDIPNIARPDLTDPDGDPVRITSTAGTTKGTIIPGFLRAGIVIYAPHEGQFGMETVSYTAYDGSVNAGTSTGTGTMTVFVNAHDNLWPVMESIGHLNVNAGHTLVFTASAIDVDGSAISYMLVGAPDGATISEQGQLRWTTSSADEGAHTFTVVAYDNRGGSDSEAVTVRVLPAGTPNRPPVVPDVSVTVDSGSSVVIAPDITDPDGDKISIASITDATKGIVLMYRDTILYISNSGSSGTDELTYTVADTRGSTATGTMAVQINSSRPEPAPAVRGTVISTKLIESHVIPKEMADSNNAFAIDFYQQLASSDDQTGKNIFFSPAGMYTTFSLLYEGAREDTAAQMQDVFGFESNNTVRHETTAHTLASINRYDSDDILRMRNALWLANWFEPYDLYTDISEIMYLTNMQGANFTDPDDSVTKINRWAASIARDNDDEIITKDGINDDTSMVLTNVVYFNGTWVTKFPQHNTDQLDFWIDGNSSTKIEFMKVEAGFNYTESDGARVLKIPYMGDRLAMLIILPQDLDGLTALEESISSQQIDDWVRNMQDRNVDLLMPKFEIKTNYDLKNHLVSLGMTDIFDKTRANLEGIINVESRGDLYLSNTIQDAYIKVDEKGAEIANSDNVAVANPTPVHFTADHPFIFTIYDEESGMILFMGKISDPVALER